MSRNDQDLNNNKEAIDTDFWEVEKIRAVRTRGGIKEYFIKWRNFSDSHSCWEPEENLNCEEAINRYLKKRKLRRRLLDQ